MKRGEIMRRKQVAKEIETNDPLASFSDQLNGVQAEDKEEKLNEFGEPRILIKKQN